MSLVVRKLFFILFYFFFLAGSQVCFAQLYDGPVGDNSIPNSYQGFDQGERPPGEINPGLPPDPSPCEFQDPLNPLCPIDDYVYVLIGLGILYGYIKFRKHNVRVV